MTNKPIGTAEVMEITGFQRRWVQVHAAAGDIPSAVQVVENGEWRFDEKTVKNWYNALRRLKCQTQTSSKGAKSITRGFKSEDATIDLAYEQLLNP